MWEALKAVALAVLAGAAVAGYLEVRELVDRLEAAEMRADRVLVTLERNDLRLRAAAIRDTGTILAVNGALIRLAHLEDLTGYGPPLSDDLTFIAEKLREMRSRLLALQAEIDARSRALERGDE
jgi:hypothetical protein